MVHNVSFGGSPLTHSSRLLLKSVLRQNRIKEVTCLTKEGLANQCSHESEQEQFTCLKDSIKNTSSSWLKQYYSPSFIYRSSPQSVHLLFNIFTSPYLSPSLSALLPSHSLCGRLKIGLKAWRYCLWPWGAVLLYPSEGGMTRTHPYRANVAIISPPSAPGVGLAGVKP